jgi:ribosomal protein S25
MIRAKYNFSTFIAYKLIKKLRVAGILEKGAKNRWNVVAQVASVTPSSTEKKKRRKSREHSWETCIPVAEALVRKNGSISHRVLRRATGIGAGTACKVLQELERKKILAPYDPVSRMRIALNGVGKTTPQKVGDESYKRPRHPDPAITTEKAIVWIKERRDEFGKTSLFGVMLDTLVGEVERLQALEKAIKGHLR